jgi:hypothetical protein
MPVVTSTSAVPPVVAGGGVELADPGQFPDGVGVAECVRAGGEAVVPKVSVVEGDPSEAGQDPERLDRFHAAAVEVDVGCRQRCGCRGVHPVALVGQAYVNSIHQ